MRNNCNCFIISALRRNFSGKEAPCPGLLGNCKGCLVGAADGYKVVFAHAEIDPAFGVREIILADKRDGKPLDAKEGKPELFRSSRNPYRTSCNNVVIKIPSNRLTSWKSAATHRSGADTLR